MTHQIEIDENAVVDAAKKGGLHEVLPDIAYQRLAMVNIAMIGPANAGDRNWVLIDAGIPFTAAFIRSAAAKRFGEKARPSAIVLTHGHFDHVGALKTLAEEWDAPIYAHELEKPFLDGSQSYPPPDTHAGGGIMPTLAPLFPRSPIDVSERLRLLPADGTVPPLPGWKWLHTPGHTPGHVSFWREADRTLIVGDAFITTKQESAYAIATQEPEMHGPPMYFTPDWPAAKRSVETLAALDPELVITGHGRPLAGPDMQRALHTLAKEFDQVAMPKH